MSFSNRSESVNLLVALGAVLLIGCDESQPEQTQVATVVIEYPELEDVVVEANARALLDERSYCVTLRNLGDEKLIALPRPEQQWKTAEETVSSWREGYPPMKQGNHLVEIEPGGKRNFIMSPYSFEDVQIRYGITLLCEVQGAITRKVIWSNIVSPDEEQWPSPHNPAWLQELKR